MDRRSSERTGFTCLNHPSPRYPSIACLQGRKMKLGKGITVIAACAVLYASPGLASAGDPYPLSPPVIKKLFVGRKVYTFSESFYRPAVVRKLPAKRLADPFSSPENVLLAYLSALVTRDTAWFVSLAEQSEQEKARRRPKQSKEEMAVAFGRQTTSSRTERLPFFVRKQSAVITPLSRSR